MEKTAEELRAELEIAKRFPDSRAGSAHFASLFAGAERNDKTVRPELIKLADRPNVPDIVRASALDRLARFAGPERRGLQAGPIDTDHPVLT